jgi:hypothetical protein
MENAETILVIVLAAFLALFLVLSIVLVAKCIQIANQVKRLTDKAEHVVDTAESVGEFFQKATGTFAVGRIISNIASAVKRREESKKGKGD